MQVFVARQPIFDAGREVVAYELLFRNGLANSFGGTDGTEATRQVMLNAFVLFGLQRLTGGKPAFINFTLEALASDLVELFPPHALAIEVLESVDPGAAAVEQCRHLREKGYTLALDDFTCGSDRGPLIQFADILKVDFRGTTPEQRGELRERFRGSSLRLLAEKVETYEEFREAVEQGFSLFQGYFFAKPEVMTQGDVPGHKGQHLRLLRELHRPGVTLEDLDRLIRQDLALSYRLLRYINSSLFALRSEVLSVRHALTLLGERDVRRWATLVALSSVANDKPSELIETALVRARFCESLCPAIGTGRELAEELFLLGLFSVLDALLDQPMPKALAEVAIPPRVKGALVGMPGEMRRVLDLVLAFEHGDWQEVDALRRTLDAEALAMTYHSAIEFAQAASAQSEVGRTSGRPPTR
jgi:c-di-GMP-related signal transduction protein